MHRKNNAPIRKAPPIEKSNLHPRNKMRFGYDFKALIEDTPELNDFVRPNPLGRDTIDFSNPKAVKLLNQALLRHFYQIKKWDVPDNYLCPPVPGRADYIHCLADLLALSAPKAFKGPDVRVLDIGTGASGIYSLIGHAEYGWSFVSTETDSEALENLKGVLESNPEVKEALELRFQKYPEQIFSGIIQKGESFQLMVCNPPFYKSAHEAAQANERKNKNLGKGSQGRNFGGKSHEIWCKGGEFRFIKNVIHESRSYSKQCQWFSTLVSDKKHVAYLRKELELQNATQIKVIPMSQGQKKSRVLAWTYRPIKAKGKTKARKKP